MSRAKVRLSMLAISVASSAVFGLRLQAATADAPSTADAALFERLDADGDGKVTAEEVSSDQKRLFSRLLRRGDQDDDRALSRDELVNALVPSRPAKPIEEKQPASFPQADAVRWLLLTMDTSGNSSIEEDEVPERLLRVYDTMVERIDGNKDGVIDRRELAQGGRPLAQIAGRYVQSAGVDTAAQLKKLEQKLGAGAKRFDSPPARADKLGDPKQARELFTQLDGNGDGQIEQDEVPQPLSRAYERLSRLGDRDGNGRLSQREFLVAAEQLARRRARQAKREAMEMMKAKSAEAMPAPEAMPAEESMPADER